MSFLPDVMKVDEAVDFFATMGNIAHPLQHCRKNWWAMSESHRGASKPVLSRLVQKGALAAA